MPLGEFEVARLDPRRLRGSEQHGGLGTFPARHVLRCAGCYGVGVVGGTGIQAGNPASGCPTALCGSTFRRR
jgi:hypothetical protein